jgi:non-specific serine/threonine protein kinase
LRSLEAFAHNLPRQLTSFIGHERDIAEVKRLLGQTALLTLTGSGGCGKTRLAPQVAADLVEEFADGVWLVELAALADPALVPQAVASVLGVREEPGRPLEATLADGLRARSLLLVLDNCEHLLTACARLADDLLRSCPRLRMLASSREGLGIAGEQAYRVPSLSLPDPKEWLMVDGQGSMADRRPHPHQLSTMGHQPSALLQFEAVQLFAERARLSQASFAITASNALAVARICQRLDGIPLALELAAARVKALPLEKLHERLDDMFRLLTGGSRTALPRQQTLRALIDWSYHLLTAPEQALLCRLSVFVGGWTLEAAETVCSGVQAFRHSGVQAGTDSAVCHEGVSSDLNARTPERLNAEDVLDLLTSLVEKSLVLYEEQRGVGRYRLLEAVRQYARDRLLESEEAEALRQRHLEFFLRLAEEAGPRLRGADSVAWLERLETEHDNLRAALAWSGAQGQADTGLRLCEALGGFWLARGYWREARERLAELLALPGAVARTAARARAQQGAAWLAWRQGELGVARTLYDESLAIYREIGDQRGTAGSLNYLGFMAREAGELGAARARFEESLTIYQELGEKGGTTWSLRGLGQVARDQGEYAAARALLGESLAISVELGDRWSRAWTLIILGEVAHDEGAYREARVLLEESLSISRELGEKRFSAMSLNRLGFVAREEGDARGARALIEESLAIFRELGHRFGIAQNLEGLAVVAVAQAQPERAARLFGAAERLRDVIGAPLPPADRAGHDRSDAAVRLALGEDGFAAAWKEGQAMTLEAAIDYALAAPSPAKGE